MERLFDNFFRGWFVATVRQFEHRLIFRNRVSFDTRISHEDYFSREINQPKCTCATMSSFSEFQCVYTRQSLYRLSLRKYEVSRAEDTRDERIFPRYPYQLQKVNDAEEILNEQSSRTLEFLGVFQHGWHRANGHRLRG